MCMCVCVCVCVCEFVRVPVCVCNHLIIFHAILYSNSRVVINLDL